LLRAVGIGLAVQLARGGRLAGEVHLALDGLGHRRGRDDQRCGHRQDLRTSHQISPVKFERCEVAPRLPPVKSETPATSNFFKSTAKPRRARSFFWGVGAEPPRWWLRNSPTQP